MAVDDLNKVEASITAQNTFSDVLTTDDNEIDFSLSGTWTATVHVQRRFSSTGSWMDVQSFTANTELVGKSARKGIQMRFGVKTGNYTNGTVVGRLSLGGPDNIDNA